MFNRPDFFARWKALVQRGKISFSHRFGTAFVQRRFRPTAYPSPPAMSYDYESDHTKFMRELLAKQPGLAAEQRKGRAIWWDKHLDAAEQEQFDAARVSQSAYVYQTKV